MYAQSTKALKKNKVKEFFLAIKSGSIWTKLSCLFMGVGQIARKQFLKGALYLVLEIAFILYLVCFGAGYLAKIGTLGTVKATEVWNDETGVYDKIPGDLQQRTTHPGYIGCRKLPCTLTCIGQ